MPITRRKRANPPEQPENNNNHVAEQTDESLDAHDASNFPDNQLAESASSATVDDAPDGAQANNTVDTTESISAGSVSRANGNGAGERGRGEQHSYTPPIEGGRRTARGELFRRPPQPPLQQQPPVPAVSAAQLQPPSHEIKLPLEGNLLHLAYNPGYTGSDEARNVLLTQLAKESKAGGRARCWNCGSIAIAYDRWHTNSKNFGDVGVALCEICGVWSVL